jgi:diguanylate cyclase (GGDEF)-like protein
MIVVPLRHEGRTVGVLNVYSPDPHSFGDEDVHTIELIGGAICAAYGHAVDLATKRGLLHEVKATVAALQQSEANLADRVLHDALTGLPNRTLFLDRLRQALASSHRDASTVAVLYVDVDHFKVVNDTLGHEAGDALLVEIANRLSASMREGDTVARFGGDEFTVCARGLREPAEASQLADRMSHAVAAPISLPGGRIATHLSIGISISGDAPTTAEEMLREADAGLYRVKRHGRDEAETVLSHIDAPDESREDLGATPSPG